MKNTIANWVLGITICISLVLGCGVIFVDHIHSIKSNRERGIDETYEFSEAWIRVGDDWKKVFVYSWRDFDNSDTVQVTAKSGVTYLTHYSNVILMTRDPHDCK